MNKSRIEAFSDGVFAIAITLLVLDIKLPLEDMQSSRQMAEQLLKASGAILTFVFSFLVIGIFWAAHHRIFYMVGQVNHFLLWSNIFYLMTVALIPFPASLLAHHPFYETAIIFYTFVLLLCGVQHFLLLFYIYRHKEVQAFSLDAHRMRRLLLISGVGPGCYLLALLLSLFTPVLGFVMIVLAVLFYVFLVPYFLPPTQNSTHQD